MSYIKINIYPCVNSTDNNNHCKPQNIINDYLQSAYFSLRIKDIGFSPFNYSFPTLPIIQYFNTALSKSIFKEYIMYFGIVEINTDIGLLFNKIKKETFLKYTRDFHTFYFQDSEKYLNKEIFSTQIMLEDYIYHQKRTFTKMSAVLSTTGGYMQFISTIFAIIALLTKKFSLELKLLNSLFNFNISQKKIILSIRYEKRLNYLIHFDKGEYNSYIPFVAKKSIRPYKKYTKPLYNYSKLDNSFGNLIQKSNTDSIKLKANEMKHRKNYSDKQLLQFKSKQNKSKCSNGKNKRNSPKFVDKDEFNSQNNIVFIKKNNIKYQI